MAPVLVAVSMSAMVLIVNEGRFQGGIGESSREFVKESRGMSQRIIAAAEATVTII